MSYDKAPECYFEYELRQSSRTIDKKSPPKSLQILCQTHPATEFSAWHTTLLKVLYKGKGDAQDPNNYHRIARKETSEKVLSIIASEI